MKTTKILPLLASFLLVGCSNSSQPASSQTGFVPPEPSSSSAVSSKMTSIDPGKMYLEINLSSKPENFGIKVGNEVITETKTIALSSDMEFTVQGTLNNVCFYRAIETVNPIVWSAGKTENVDEEVASNMLGRYLTRIAATQSGARVYFCITDTVGGWNKTIPGVDWVITNYSYSL